MVNNSGWESCIPYGGSGTQTGHSTEFSGYEDSLAMTTNFLQRAELIQRQAYGRIQGYVELQIYI